MQLASFSRWLTGVALACLTVPCPGFSEPIATEIGTYDQCREVYASFAHGKASAQPLSERDWKKIEEATGSEIPDDVKTGTFVGPKTSGRILHIFIGIGPLGDKWYDTSRALGRVAGPGNRLLEYFENLCLSETNSCGLTDDTCGGGLHRPCEVSRKPYGLPSFPRLVIGADGKSRFLGNFFGFACYCSVPIELIMMNATASGEDPTDLLCSLRGDGKRAPNVPAFPSVPLSNTDTSLLYELFRAPERFPAEWNLELHSKSGDWQNIATE